MRSVEATGRRQRAEQRVDELVGVERDEVGGRSRRRRRPSPGCPSSDWIASTMPPLAVPSSLVSTTPVTSTASANCARLRRARSGRCVASITSSTSLSAPGRAVDDAAQLLQLLHEVDLGVQPAGGVDEHEVGAAARRPRSSRRTRPSRGRRPPGPARARRRRARPSARAARRRRRGTCRPRPARRAWPSSTSRCASLAIVVVLPDAVDARRTSTRSARPAIVRASRSPLASSSADQLVVQQRRRSASASDDPLGSAPAPRTSSRMRCGGGQADVGEEQRLLELVPGLVVDLAPAADRGERAGRTRRGSCPAGRAGGAPRRPRPRRRLGLDLDVDSGTTGVGSSTSTGFGGAGGAGGRGGGRPAARDAAARPRRAARRCERRDRPTAERDERDREHEDQDDDEHGLT